MTKKNDPLLKKGALRTYIENIANKDSKKYYIVLDEIQLVDDFVRAVNSLNKHSNYDIYINCLFIRSNYRCISV